MSLRKPDQFDIVAARVSDLYVAIEDYREEASDESRLKVLDLFQGLRESMEAAEKNLGIPTGRSFSSRDVETPDYSGPLKVGSVYTRLELRELFEIRDATLNNGVFTPKNRSEIWLFVTENKSADREQYVDKLDGDTLFWDGQRLGRTDQLIIDHKLNSHLLLLFYRRSKTQFDGAGFVFEGLFQYVRHWGSQPTSFVLQRQHSK